MANADSSARGVIRSLGLVFGDIGTSPIYTLTVIFLLTDPTPDHTIGVVSLIIWTLIILVYVEYAWLATGLGRRGEGGTIVLKELLVPLLRTSRQAGFVTVLSFIGISLLIGDGVITPSISILSAVEGMLLIPGLEKTGHWLLIMVAGIIAVVLFAFQKKGTEKVAGAFGPIMVIWFLSLIVSGCVSIASAPRVMQAVNPYYAVRFLIENGLAGFFVLSEVILCATGGEALYADMGHLGRAPIVRAWHFVFGALVVNYLGQGAFLVTHPGAKNVLFEMIYAQAPMLYIPFLVLSIAATVIASQAMISGMFSIVYQGIATRVMPLLKVDYTSAHRESQIYIGAVNWFLLAAVLFIMFEFRESSKLAAAYGLAVTGTMTLTAVMMTWIFHRRGRRFRAGVSLFVTVVCSVYLFSNLYKIPHGGYWSIVLAAIPFGTILLYTKGQRRLYRALKPMPLETFLQWYRDAYRTRGRISGTALFFAKDIQEIPPYMSNTMQVNGILYEETIVVSVIKRPDPFGVTWRLMDQVAPGLRLLEIQAGYMEVVDVEEILREEGIFERAIFYGIEEISTRNLLWKLFATIKKQTPSFVQFYNLPPYKLHGVITRIEM